MIATFDTGAIGTRGRTMFEPLLSERVLAEGMLASNVRSLWRRLARCADVRDVGRQLASDPARIRALCGFVRGLLTADYDVRYRHPHDIAIAAALVLLEQSPLAEARALMHALKREPRPSLHWVRVMAEYCDSRFVDERHYGQQWPASAEDNLASATYIVYRSSGEVRLSNGSMVAQAG